MSGNKFEKRPFGEVKFPCQIGFKNCEYLSKCKYIPGTKCPSPQKKFKLTNKKIGTFAFKNGF
jgi:hypothetical protein